MKALKKLHALDAKLSKAVEFRSMNEEQEPRRRGMGGTLAAGALIGTGAYRYGADAVGAMRGGATMGNAASIAKRKIAEDLAMAGNKGSQAYVAGKGMLKTAKRSYGASRVLAKKGVLASAVTAARKVTGLSEKQVAKMIVELDAKIDQIADSRAQRMEFAKKPMPFKKKSKKDMDGDMDNSKGKC